MHEKVIYKNMKKLKNRHDIKNYIKKYKFLCAKKMTA